MLTLQPLFAAAAAISDLYSSVGASRSQAGPSTPSARSVGSCNYWTCLNAGRSLELHGCWAIPPDQGGNARLAYRVGPYFNSKSCAPVPPPAPACFIRLTSIALHQVLSEFTRLHQTLPGLIGVHQNPSDFIRLDLIPSDLIKLP
eukprot:1157771-Pelagomonas_calceolata.AAC.6